MNPQFNPKTLIRKIEWTDYTWNPITGCVHDCQWEMKSGKRAVTAECYAKRIAESKPMAKFYPLGFKYHYFRPDRLGEPIALHEPSLIFVDSMSDLFAANVPDYEIERVLEVCRQCPQHVFQSLTKAPKRLLKFTHLFSQNMWIGVSSPPDWFMGKLLTHDQQVRFVSSCFEALAEVKQANPEGVVWMSIEPLSWDISSHMGNHGLDWAVLGAASAGQRIFQPVATHVSNVLRQLARTNTPVFYKGNLEWEPRREEFPATGDWPAVARRKQMAAIYDWPSYGDTPEPLSFIPPLSQGKLF